MNLSSPTNLLWLIPTFCGIIALWLLKVRRRDQPVSSLYLWRGVTPVAKSDSLFQKLRRNLLLFLQLLAAFLLILALAGPATLARKPSNRSYAIVVDNSAGMNAIDTNVTRLDAAKARAVDLLTHWYRRGDRICILQGCGQPRVVQPWTESINAAGDAIRAIESTDEPRDLNGMITGAAANCASAPRGSARIVLCSDGAWESTVDPAAVSAAGGLPVEVQAAAISQCANVGIVSIQARTDPHDALGRMVFVRLFNSSSMNVRAASLTATMGDRAVYSGRVDIAARGFSDATFAVHAEPSDQVLTVRVSGTPGDALAADNTARLVIPPARRMRVLLVSRGSLFLERALTANPGADVYECAPGAYTPADIVNFDLGIFDGWAPATMPNCNCLFFNAIAADSPVTLRSMDRTKATMPIVDWNQTHPVMRFVDLADVHISGQIIVDALPWAQTVAETDSGPVIVAGERYGRRVLWSGFSLAESDFAMKAAFPIFVQNAMEWLRGAPDMLQGGRPGDGIPIPVGAGDWRLISPASTLLGTCPASASRACEIDAADTSLAGLYTLSYLGTTRKIALNVASVATSDILSRDHPLLMPGTASSSRARPQWIPAAPWVLVTALALLLLEWIVYHRVGAVGARRSRAGHVP